MVWNLGIVFLTGNHKYTKAASVEGKKFSRRIREIPSVSGIRCGHWLFNLKEIKDETN